MWVVHSYHPRQDLTQLQLQAYEVKAQTQESEILLFLKHNQNVSVTCETLPKYLISMVGVPITSIRRALTNLANAGKIVKVGQVTGQYGRPINVYRADTGVMN